MFRPRRRICCKGDVCCSADNRVSLRDRGLRAVVRSGLKCASHSEPLARKSAQEAKKLTIRSTKNHEEKRRYWGTISFRAFLRFSWLSKDRQSNSSSGKFPVDKVVTLLARACDGSPRSFLPMLPGHRCSYRLAGRLEAFWLGLRCGPVCHRCSDRAC